MEIQKITSLKMLLFLGNKHINICIFSFTSAFYAPPAHKRKCVANRRKGKFKQNFRIDFELDSS
jgi:hypothetical protein